VCAGGDALTAAASARPCSKRRPADAGPAARKRWPRLRRRISDAIDGRHHDTHCLKESDVLVTLDPANWIGDKGWATSATT
jgi:hypothetical protein